MKDWILTCFYYKELLCACYLPRQHAYEPPVVAYPWRRGPVHLPRRFGHPRSPHGSLRSTIAFDDLLRRAVSMLRDGRDPTVTGDPGGCVWGDRFHLHLPVVLWSWLATGK